MRARPRIGFSAAKTVCVYDSRKRMHCTYLSRQAKRANRAVQMDRTTIHDASAQHCAAILTISSWRTGSP